MSRMADQWIVRVEGREYGPVDLEELRAWKREGRLIRENEIREPGSERWIRAEELPEIFADGVRNALAETLRLRAATLSGAAHLG